MASDKIEGFKVIKDFNALKVIVILAVWRIFAMFVKL